MKKQTYTAWKYIKHKQLDKKSLSVVLTGSSHSLKLI